MLHQSTRIPLFGTQRTMLSYEQLYPGKATFHHSVAMELSQKIDEEILRKALLRVSERHEILRATILEDNKQTWLSIQPSNSSCELFVTNSNLPALPPVLNLYQTLKELGLNKLLDAPFSLKEGPLWRAGLIKSQHGPSQFFMVFHHIIIDAASTNIILRDLTTEYNSILKGRESTLAPIPSLVTCNFTLTAEEFEIRSGYWQKKLMNLNSLILHTDQPAQKSFRFAGKRSHFTLDAELMELLKKIGKKSQVTLNNVLLAGLYSLLYQYSGETDICIGITSANRRYKNVPKEVIEQLVNCFFNSVPLRLTFDSKTTFNDLLKQIKIELKAALENQLPLEDVQNALTTETKSTLQIASPFNILFVFNRKKPRLQLNEIEASYPVEVDLGCSKTPHFGMSIDKQYDGSCTGFAEYNTDLFNQTTIGFLIEHFKKILRHVSVNTECEIASIPLLLETEKKLIHEFNNTAEESNEDLTVPAYFQQVAHKFAERRAVVFHTPEKMTSSMTYTELEIYSNQIANYLQNQFGSLQGKTIGISLKRSTYLLAAILAILKSGGILAPLETEMSDHLLNKMQVASLDLLLTDQKTNPLFSAEILKLRFPELRKLNLVEPNTNEAIQACSSDYTSVASNTMPVYIISTSGTTSGEQKALMLMHDGFSNLLYELVSQGIQPGSRVLDVYPATFDAFYYNVLVAIATGGEFHLCFEDGRTDPMVLNDMIRRENINYAVLMPDLIAQLDPSLPLTHIVTMGDIPNDAVLAAFKEKKPSASIQSEHNTLEESLRVQNGYGTSEGGICDMIDGRPIRNKQIYILNPATLAICPPGIPGEIFLGGKGLAKCFVGNSDLTKQKFKFYQFDPTTHRFSVLESEEEGMEKPVRLYATGDYGCYALLPDGTLTTQFIGRNDGQVKIHGLRINLNAVKKLLEDHPLIKEACVIINPASSSTNKSLIAYIVPVETEKNDSLSKQLVREYLATSSLAKAGYPRDIVFLQKIPVTKNGKPDTRALPRPQPDEEVEVKLSLTKQQKILQQGWRHVLNGEPLLNRSFSEQGGDSILYTALTNRLVNTYHLYFNITTPLELRLDMYITEAEKYLLTELQYKLLTYWQAVLECPFSDINSQKCFLAQLPEKEQNEANQEVYRNKLLAQFKMHDISCKKNFDLQKLLHMTIFEAEKFLENKTRKHILVPNISLGTTLFAPSSKPPPKPKETHKTISLSLNKED